MFEYDSTTPRTRFELHDRGGVLDTVYTCCNSSTDQCFGYKVCPRRPVFLWWKDGYEDVHERAIADVRCHNVFCTTAYILAEYSSAVWGNDAVLGRHVSLPTCKDIYHVGAGFEFDSAARREYEKDDFGDVCRRCMLAIPDFHDLLGCGHMDGLDIYHIQRTPSRLTFYIYLRLILHEQIQYVQTTMKHQAVNTLWQAIGHTV